jgi:hypothetical protein
MSDVMVVENSVVSRIGEIGVSTVTSKEWTASGISSVKRSNEDRWSSPQKSRQTLPKLYRPEWNPLRWILKIFLMTPPEGPRTHPVRRIITLQEKVDLIEKLDFSQMDERMRNYWLRVQKDLSHQVKGWEWQAVRDTWWQNK